MKPLSEAGSMRLRMILRFGNRTGGSARPRGRPLKQQSPSHKSLLSVMLLAVQQQRGFIFGLAPIADVSLQRGEPPVWARNGQSPIAANLRRITSSAVAPVRLCQGLYPTSGKAAAIGLREKHVAGTRIGRMPRRPRAAPREVEKTSRRAPDLAAKDDRDGADGSTPSLGRLAIPARSLPAAMSC